MVEDWIWIPALGVLLVGLAIVVYKAMFEPQHLAFDAGDGMIKVDCPDDIEIRKVHLRPCPSFPCPHCGQKLIWPKEKHQWCRVDS